MGKIAFVFAGQGAQYSGMGQSLCEMSPAARAVFQRRFGKLLKHPMVPAARSLSLEQLLGFAKLYLPKPVIQDTLEELRRL